MYQGSAPPPSVTKRLNLPALQVSNSCGLLPEASSPAPKMSIILSTQIQSIHLSGWLSCRNRACPSILFWLRSQQLAPITFCTEVTWGVPPWSPEHSKRRESPSLSPPSHRRKNEVTCYLTVDALTSLVICPLHPSEVTSHLTSPHSIWRYLILFLLPGMEISCTTKSGLKNNLLDPSKDLANNSKFDQ